MKTKTLSLLLISMLISFAEGQNAPLSLTTGSNTFLDNLYAYYKLDEGSGIATDVSGNGHDLSQGDGVIGTGTGVINGARTWIGGFNGPFLFDASSTATFQPGANHIFISCWVKSNVTTYGYDAGIAGKFILPHASWLLFRQSDSGGKQLRFLCMTDGGTIGATAIGPLLTDASWHFVAAGWDGTNLKISVDGDAYSTTAYTGPIFGDGTGHFMIGAEAASNTWNGLIDEVAIWIGRNDLTIFEVQQLYNGGAGLPYSSFQSSGATPTPTPAPTGTPAPTPTPMPSATPTSTPLPTPRPHPTHHR